MSYIDLFAEGVAFSTMFDTLLDTDSLPSDQVASPSMAPFNGEFAYDVFGMGPSGAGVHATFDFKGQVSNDFATWQDVPGLAWQWTDADGFGMFGVRVANGRIPKVQIASANSLGADNRRQHRRWVVTGTGGSGSWALNRFFLSWALHKGSTPENQAAFNFQPGNSRLKLDFGY